MRRIKPQQNARPNVRCGRARKSLGWIEYRYVQRGGMPACSASRSAMAEKHIVSEVARSQQRRW
jgi:hypothetical protein